MARIYTIWKRNYLNYSRIHVCQELQTKNIAKNWMGRVREIKSMINVLKINQNKVVETNLNLVMDNKTIKEPK